VNGGRGDRVDIELSPSNGMGRIAHGRPNHRRSALLPAAGSALLLGGLLTFGVTGWEHLFHTAHLGLAGVPATNWRTRCGTARWRFRWAWLLW